MSESPVTPLSYRMPAAVLCCWRRQPREEPDLIDAELFRLAKRQPGFHLVAPGTLAISAESGDAALVDTAVEVAHNLAAMASQSNLAATFLVLPGELHLTGSTATLAGDLLVERAPQSFAELEAGPVHVTGWALQMMELPRQVEGESVKRDTHRRQPPLFRIGRRELESSPWRNPEILNRKVKPVSRTELLDAGRDLLSSPAWRIEGPVGCGKTFFAHHLLAAARIPRLWLRCEPEHRLSGSPAERLLEQATLAAAGTAVEAHLPLRHQPDPAWLTRADETDETERLTAVVSRLAASADRTFCLVVDDLDQSDPVQLELLEQILAMQELGKAFRLLLVGRPATPLTAALQNLPSLHVGPFTAEETDAFSPQLFAGLSLPRSTQQRLHEDTAGCPFALEEAMIALIRQQDLRQIYGGFFFAGEDSTGFSPSPRLLAHLQAESFRLGIEEPAHLLSQVATGLPPEILGQAAGRLDLQPKDQWAQAGVAGGLLQQTDTPWGPGVRFDCPVFGSILGSGLDPASVTNMRDILGRTLAAASSSGKALWEAYELLQGSPAAIEPLLAALDTSETARIPRQNLLEILTRELHRHRERNGDYESEMQLLWKLLPLARKMGRLNEFTDDLERSLQLAEDQPRRLLAIAGLKAELDQDAGRYDKAEQTIRMALEAAKGADERRQALLLIQLARLHLDQERFTDARQLLERLTENLERSGMAALSASCLYYLGNIAFHEERYEEALELHREALERRRQQNLSRVAGNSLTAIGAVYLALGNYPQALACYREALELLDEHGGDLDRAFPLIGLGRALNRLGDYTSASGSLREALTLRAGKDDIAGEALARLAIAENHLHLGQLDRAQEEATKALFQLNLLSRRALLADAEQLLGRIQIRSRQPENARRHLQEALALHQAKGNPRSIAFDKAYLLQLAMIEEDVAETLRLSAELENAVTNLARPDLEEQLHFRIFLSRRWLRDRGQNTSDPLPFLEKSYDELLRKASHLEPRLRHHFLFQIADYRDILEEGSRAGLTAEPSA